MATQKKKWEWQTKHVIIISVLAILLVIIGFSIKPIMNHFSKKELSSIIEVLNSENEHKSIEQCKLVLNFDKSTVWKKNKFFDEKKYDELALQCDENYNLEHVELDKDNCRFIIRETENYFKRNYIIYDSLAKKRLECSTKYLNPSFSTGNFFDINNDFKSQVFIDFELDFFRDAWEENSDEYIENRLAAKKRLIDLIEIEPSIEINLDDVYLYPQRAILNLALEPTSSYTIGLLPYETDMWEQTNYKKFSFKTPENKYFGMRIKNPVSIYTKDNLPNFEIIDYNTEKVDTTISMCRISPESYAEVEVYLKTWEKTRAKEYFMDWMKWLELEDCINKEISFKEESNINKNEFVRKDFSFTDFNEEENPNWLFIVFFPDVWDVEYNWKINKPILFGVVNSHIMMKVSKEWQWFFFINDFDWNPVANQEVVVYLNDFEEIETTWNATKRDYDVEYNLPLNDTKVFSWAISLWKTWENGILEVDMKEKVDNFFTRTFSSKWEYNWSWLYNSFFIESFGEWYRSYLTSTWSAWIAPWNFGYTTDWTDDENVYQLYQYNDTNDYNAHIYTDRRLYLPWETVNIKTVIRDATDLSIPEENTEFKLVVSDSKWEEVMSKTFKTNEFGSHSESFTLRQELPLGAYSITLLNADRDITYSGFNVEVFKNPKFTNEVSLSVIGLDNELVKITETTQENYNYWSEDIYKWNFTIKWKVSSKYYSWWDIKNTDFTYKVYKQYHYDNNYWDDCYYWCYWEPYKEFYTEWTWKIDENGVWTFELDVDFASSYNDYKYIVEVTVTDTAWDTITGSNSIIARLPSEYKKWNNNLDIYFTADERFVPVWGKVNITWWLNVWDWVKWYNNKYIFAIKKKEYLQDKVTDANGYTRLVGRVNEVLEKVMFINYENFKLNGQWKLELSYKLDENSEYVFEFGSIDNYAGAKFLWLDEWESIKEKDLEKIISEFDKTKALSLEKEVKEKVEKEYCNEVWRCWMVEEEQIVTKKLRLDDFILWNNYLSVITYNDATAKNPIENDNKLRVLTEKVSYNIWEIAKVLVRLPVSNSKILWTEEKNGVVKHEYIDVKWNVFFKEFVVDESFAPNTYIWVMMVDKTKNVIPEYRVWYTEVVIDKTDKKSFITAKTNKETYKPREEVKIDLDVRDKNWNPVKSELTVMVVDDSLISLMWNVDLNTLEKMFVKLPFSVQTSITNIAMLKNYYFSRMWIVWGSGYGDMKWWDSAISTRNIFKNTAYYNPSVVTDEYGKASVSFNLPDNLTNFRLMAISNSKDNHFGYTEKFIEVRKNVIVEDKTPLVLRDWDVSIIWANVFNNTKTDMDFKISIEADNASIPTKEQSIKIKAGDNTFVSWQIWANSKKKEINYKITAIWNSLENSDSISNKISIEEDPTLVRNIIKSGIALWASTLNLESQIPDNTDLENSRVEIVVSNSKLSWIEKILKSLAVYPYWCVEQTVSATVPNVIIKSFESMFEWIFDMEQINKNIKDWVERILAMQNSDWWFVYWPWNSSSDLHITPYVLRSLVYMKEAWIEISDDVINRAIKYLETNLEDKSLDDVQKTEIFWALASAWKKPQIEINLNKLDRHSLIAYTYWLEKLGSDRALVRTNIEKIKALLASDNTQSWYWDNTSDKWIFASLLIEKADKNDEAYIEQIINDLYAEDWESFYYSTQAKNNAFIAFHNYLTKASENNSWKFTFRLGSYNDNKTYNLWGDKPNLLKFEYSLANVKLTDNLIFSLNNLGDTKLYVDYIIKQYPQDKTKVEPYANWMQVKRETFEVLDESLLSKCSDDYWYDKNKVECSKVLWKVKTDNVYEKWKLYKTTVTVTFDSEKARRMLTIEDFLPWAFRVINSNFKTESSAIKGASQNWNWDYKEFNPWVVMANASYVWWKTATFEYYFRAEFEWTYTRPPVTAYMMYNPLIRASGRFTNIEVK